MENHNVFMITTLGNDDYHYVPVSNECASRTLKPCLQATCDAISFKYRTIPPIQILNPTGGIILTQKKDGSIAEFGQVILLDRLDCNPVTIDRIYRIDFFKFI